MCGSFCTITVARAILCISAVRIARGRRIPAAVKHAPITQVTVRAFQKMLEVRKAEGKVDRCNWSDGESVMRWWLQDDTIDGQLSFFDDD